MSSYNVSQVLTGKPQRYWIDWYASVRDMIFDISISIIYFNDQVKSNITQAAQKFGFDTVEFYIIENFCLSWNFF